MERNKISVFNPGCRSRSGSIWIKESHSLIYLLDLLIAKENVPDSLYETAEVLEDYGVEVRYPGDGQHLLKKIYMKPIKQL
jgi:hypothetical protein